MPEFDFYVTPPPDFSPLVYDISVHTFVHQFEKIAMQYPDKTAIKSGKQSCTYAELDNAINNLAFEILGLTGDDKSPVAYLHQNEFLGIVTLFGTLKAGKIYVGLHPSISPEQILSYLQNAGSKLLITSSEYSDLAGELIQAIPDLKVHFFDELKPDFIHNAPPYHVNLQDPMAITYTSGSTGEAKGVAIGHLTRNQTLKYQINGWKFSPSDQIALVTSVAYLASSPSLFGALLTGATLCLFDIKNNSAQKALDWIINEKLTVFRSTPSIFRSIFGLAPKDWVFPDLRFLTLGGEPVPATDIELFKQHTRPDCVLVNNYSCTEVGSICHNPVTHDHPTFEGYLPAGYPAPGKEIIINGEDEKPVPNGEFGEVTVRSKYMSIGYWNNEALTNERYAVEQKTPEIRVYFTGDLGRILPNGKLEVKGRKDTQVKLRGFRIQLEALDIELQKLPGVIDAASKIHLHESAGERLAAFIVTKDEEPIQLTQYREILKKQLPNFMIPSVFVQLDSLPRTATGKISRKELPEPLQQRPDLNTPYIEPKPGEEKQIASIWADLLGFDQVGINDNFFELGGDSLLALQMTLEVENLTGKQFPKSFFEQPTIRTLCQSHEYDKEIDVEAEFKLQSFSGEDDRENLHPTSAKNRRKKSRNHPLTQYYRIADQLIGRQLGNLPFQEGQQKMVNISSNKLLLNTIYHTPQKLFKQWSAEVDTPADNPFATFNSNFLNNMYFVLPRPAYRNNVPINNRFKQTMTDFIKSASVKELLAVFPIAGLENLTNALKNDRGAIITSYHGPPRQGGFSILEKVLGVEEINTVSHLIPLRQSGLHTKHYNLPESTTARLNAEISLFGQRQLLEGKIISYFSDTRDTSGRTYNVTLGSRVYQMKAGVPEMALNTGAAIVPFTRYCLPDGRIQMEFFPEIILEVGPRARVIEQVINSYAAFINRCWRDRPDAVSWDRIRSHFQRPLAKNFSQEE